MIYLGNRRQNECHQSPGNNLQMTPSLQRNRREPVWRPQRQLYNLPINPKLADWLLDTSSLTKRLVASCNGAFSVQIDSQAWARPMRNEARRLGMRTTSRALIRQVHLTCNGQAWVFARTVIPSHTLSGKQRRLAKLGKKPLGAVLFADKSMQRSEVEIANIRPGQALYDLATKYNDDCKQEIWGRRTVFYLNRHPLLVSEIFLPVLIK